MGQIFTFGVGHVDPLHGLSLANCYVEAPEEMDAIEARRWMVERYGMRWAFQYDDRREANVESWGLTRVEPINPDLASDLPLRQKLGRLYFDRDWWRMVVRECASRLEAGEDPAKVATRLRNGGLEP